MVSMRLGPWYYYGFKVLPRVVQGLLVACTTQALYWYLLIASAKKNVLPPLTWEMIMHQTITVVASATVQTFFAYRVYVLSTSIMLGCLVELLSLAQFGLGIASAYQAYHLASFITLPQQKRWLIGSWLLMEAICDVTLAASMTILLRRQRTGFRQTDNMLNKLIVYSINTGTITSVIAIIICVTFAINGFGSDVLVLGIPFSAVYNCTMLANLHYRTQLRQRLGPVSMGNTSARSNLVGVKVTVDKTVEPPPSTLIPLKQLRRERNAVMPREDTHPAVDGGTIPYSSFPTVFTVTD
ncbi:uncharacterized protein EI90DRAFT_3032597 [Cantharellus anzutake]|uniref:uncharacterized protein n=1 Tax=Cantharellus anzutake TaxID=1750568 RepID=UPI001905E2CF|nr:uncharacterized protein EI90DRAFT_3032597 [Cantharellus anzutake]KAF8342245.1 hypothetical protein EI90DRAFT_3032597 [Cantharellus anzutake]